MVRNRHQSHQSLFPSSRTLQSEPHMIDSSRIRAFTHPSLQDTRSNGNEKMTQYSKKKSAISQSHSLQDMYGRELEEKLEEKKTGSMTEIRNVHDLKTIVTPQDSPNQLGNNRTNEAPISVSDAGITETNRRQYRSQPVLDREEEDCRYGTVQCSAGLQQYFRDVSDKDTMLSLPKYQDGSQYDQPMRDVSLSESSNPSEAFAMSSTHNSNHLEQSFSHVSLIPQERSDRHFFQSHLRPRYEQHAYAYNDLTRMENTSGLPFLPFLTPGDDPDYESEDEYVPTSSSPPSVTMVSQWNQGYGIPAQVPWGDVLNEVPSLHQHVRAQSIRERSFYLQDDFRFHQGNELDQHLQSDHERDIAQNISPIASVTSDKQSSLADFSWKKYPELEIFLDQKSEEYSRLSTNMNIVQKQNFKNDLTKRLFSIAAKNEYALDEHDPRDFAIVRSKIESYCQTTCKSHHASKKRSISPIDRVSTKFPMQHKSKGH